MDIILSVIVPIYNVELYLNDCLNSIVNQNINNFEILLIDDGSTDQSSRICDDYASLYENIRIFHKQNGGVSSARNVGLRNAKGKYITFVDSDDMIASDTYYNNIMFMQKHPEVDMLQYPTIWNYMAKDEHADCISAKLIFGKDKIYAEWWRGDTLNFSVWNKIFKRHVFDFVFFPEGHVFEDFYIVPDLLTYINIVYISQEGNYYYIKRENSISVGEYPLYKHLDLFKAQVKNCKVLYSYSNLKRCRSICFLRAFYRLLVAISEYPDFSPKQQLNKLSFLLPHFVDIINSDISFKERLQILMMRILGLKIYVSFIKYKKTDAKIKCYYTSL